MVVDVDNVEVASKTSRRVGRAIEAIWNESWNHVVSWTNYQNHLSHHDTTIHRKPRGCCILCSRYNPLISDELTV